ncbi:MAG: hypothetical protein BMS9Abin36_1988 [Gammaproteobacteria bacterium]|nr:MAG: hypothetical protein BMS9Abin36_1988 [Gammaproteobacteria bacterium]
MQLRNQLLSYFFILILAVISIFGWNAYYFAYDSVRRTEHGMMQSQLTHHSEMLAREYARVKTLQHLLNHLPRPESGELLNAFLVRQNDNEPIFDSAGILPKKFDGIVDRWRALDSSTQHQGNFSYGDDVYIWSRAPVPGSFYDMVVMRKSSVTQTAPLKTLYSRLAVTGLIVLWVALWVALIISTVVSRRLARQQQELVHQANHDNLTQLPNRHHTRQLLKQAIKQAKHGKATVALVIIDLDRFKEVNDALGHEVGDRLLQNIAQRFNESMWQQDKVTRMGGNEFAMILAIASEDHISRVANKVIDLSDVPFVIDGTPLSIEATLGIAVYPRDGNNADTLMRKAEVAMYSARETGQAFGYYQPENDPHSRERLHLTAELRGAAERKELLLHFQPKMNLADGKFIGVEALCRWNHPVQGLIPPNRFIPIAEQTGIIRPLTNWVLEASMRQCAQWQRDGHDITVSANLSARLLHDINLPGRVAELLKKTGFPAEMLELEITETALMIDPGIAGEVLSVLHAMGVKLSLDDFGAGYMSLSYLRQLPVNHIKIDMSFIRNMLIDPGDSMIVNTIIDLAHNLGCTVIAEGVESSEVYSALHSRGCDAVQGYYISRPLPAADFKLWLQKQERGLHPSATKGPRAL